MPLKGFNSDYIKKTKIAKDQFKYRSSAIFEKICYFGIVKVLSLDQCY